MLAMFTALLLKSQDKDIDLMTKQIEKKETFEAHKKLSTMNSQELGDFDDNKGNSCTNFKEKCCSGERWRQRCSDFADTFVKVFGGEDAMKKRKRLKR